MNIMVFNSLCSLPAAYLQQAEVLLCVSGVRTLITCILSFFHNVTLIPAMTSSLNCNVQLLTWSTNVVTAGDPLMEVVFSQSQHICCRNMSRSRSDPAPRRTLYIRAERNLHQEDFILVFTLLLEWSLVGVFCVIFFFCVRRNQSKETRANAMWV